MHKHFDTGVASSRRGFGAGLMAAAGGAGLVSLRPQAGAAAAMPGLPTDPAAITRAKVKIAGSLTPMRVSWATTGRIYAVRPEGVSPLYDVLGCETGWWEQIGEHSWIRYFSANSVFFELGTTKPLYEFKSPFNGQTVPIRPTNIRHKEGFVYSPQGDYFPSVKARHPQRYADHAPTPKWRRDGDLIRYLEEDHFAPELPQPVREVMTQFASASAVLDDSVDWADAQIAGWNIGAGASEPFTSMGLAPGLMNWHFDGYNIRDLRELEPVYLSEIRRIQPEFDENPKHDTGPTLFERLFQMIDAAKDGEAAAP